MFKIKMPKVEPMKKRLLEDVEDGMINIVWPDLHSVGVPVTFMEKVKEVNGVKTIMYDVSLTCTESQWIELRVRLGVKGYNTPKQPENEDE